MRINRTSSKTNGLPSTGSSTPTNPQSRDSGVIERGQITTSEYLPSEELAQMIAAASQEPELRPANLQQAADRLASGYYLTSESANLTANAIQQARD